MFRRTEGECWRWGLTVHLAPVRGCALMLLYPAAGGRVYQNVNSTKAENFVFLLACRFLCTSASWLYMVGTQFLLVELLNESGNRDL